MYAVSVNSFLAPNGIINGGFTGIATILNRLFSLPIGTAVFIMNIPLFFLAYKKLGKSSKEKAKKEEVQNASTGCAFNGGQGVFAMDVQRTNGDP